MFRALAQKAKNNDFVKGGLILFTGSMTGNILAYLYNIIIGRILEPEYFGVFSSIVAIGYIISVFSATLSLLIAKFSAEYVSKNDMNGIYSIFKYTTNRFLILGGILLGFFVATAPLISNFLKIDSVVPILILTVSLVVAFFVAINRGVLQGTLKFLEFSINTNAEMLLRIVISVLFVFIGWKVNGALLGLSLGIIIAYALSFIPIKKMFHNAQREQIDTHLIKKYAVPLFISFLGMTLLYTVDIILVKHYLSDYDTGIYSALSIFGKIIFFASGSIALALFPMAAERNASGKEHKYLLLGSLIIVSVISLLILGVYFFMPRIVVGLFLGKEFLEASPYLMLFGLVMFFYSLINILINYYLSINKTAVSYLPFIFSIILLILIIFFHQSLKEIIYIRIIHMALLLIAIPIFNVLYKKNEPAAEPNS